MVTALGSVRSPQIRSGEYHRGVPRGVPRAPLCLDDRVSDPATLALIAAGAALFGGAIAQGGAYLLEHLRFRNTTRASRLEDTLKVIDSASTAFVHARMALDNALSGNTNKIDSVPLFTALSEHSSRITLRLGSAHPIASTYAQAVETWAEAVTTAIQPPSTERNQALASLRNDAHAAHQRFLDASAPYLGPEAESKKSRKQLEAPKADT